MLSFCCIDHVQALDVIVLSWVLVDVYRTFETVKYGVFNLHICKMNGRTRLNRASV